MKKLRYLIRLAGALLTKYYPILGIGLVLGSLTFFGLPYLLRILPPWRSTQTIAVVGHFTSSDIPLFIQSQISTGLTTLDPSGLPQPAIATSWSVSADGKSYVFTLNPNLTWQDGTPLRSSDINYQFRDATTQYISDTELVLTLKDSYAPLPVVVSRPVFKRGLLGTGSYRVGSIKRNGSLIDSLTLVPVDKDSHQPNIRYRFYATESAARLAFKLGLARSIMDVQEAGDLKDWPTTQVTSQLHQDRYVAIFFNTKDPFLTGQAGKDIRLALAYATDKSRWSNRAYGPVNPNSWAYFSEIKRYELDIKRAKDLLAKVENQPDSLTLSTIPAYLSVAEAIKSDWEALGLKVNVVVAAEPTVDYQALVMAQAIPSDPDQYNLWHSTQASNLTGLDNPRIDKLLEDGRKTQDISERKRIYQDLQKFLVEEVPAVFLFHPTSYTISRK